MKISKVYRPELVVSKGKEANPILTDPFLDVKEDRLVATDGHALVAVPVQTDKGERSRFLACSLLEAARKLGEDDQPAEIQDQEIVEFGVLWPAAQERSFPDWRKLVPSFHQGDPGTVTMKLNARLLKSLADAMGSGGGVALTFDPAQPKVPILVQPLLPDPEELGLLMPLGEPGEADVDPDQRCPVCRKLLAAGAACPEHGRPPMVPALAQAVERVKEAAAAIDGGGASITVRVGGKEVTATPAQLRAGLEELKRRKAAAVPALDWVPCYGGFEADLPDGGSFRIAEAREGYDLGRVKPGKKAISRIGNFPTETDARKRAAEILTEDAGDAMLRNAGAGELTKADTKGPAVTRKKGGRRG